MRSPRREYDGRCDAKQQEEVMANLRMTMLIIGATGSIGRLVVGEVIRQGDVGAN
jgi:FlaA1/EpsC-like NDP-sugar epimerase